MEWNVVEEGVWRAAISPIATQRTDLPRWLPDFRGSNLVRLANSSTASETNEGTA